jgi:hypothetical protein
MAKVQSLAAAFVATGCVALVAVAALRASDPQAPPPGQDPIKEKVQAVAPPERQERLFLFDEREAHKDSLMSVFGNMRPLLRDAKGVRFQSRLAVLTKQGTVRLWSPDSKNPVVPPLRHADPIREVGFLDQANLLITTSETSVKVWNALTGELRKEIEGEVMRPLLLAAIGSCAEAGHDPVRFATIDTSGRFVTTWDAATLKQVGTFRPEGAAKLLGAGLTRNGKTLATIGEDRSVTLWVVGENKPLATFHAPSPLVARCFVDDQHCGNNRRSSSTTVSGKSSRRFCRRRPARSRETVRTDARQSKGYSAAGGAYSVSGICVQPRKDVEVRCRTALLALNRAGFHRRRSCREIDAPRQSICFLS